MPVIVACQCGQRFKAIDELMGTRVNCPACGQPLDIPASEPPQEAEVPPSSGLDQAADFEQSAPMPSAPLHAAPGMTGTPGYAVRPSSADEGFSRGVIIAMWIGGGAVALLVLAMVVTSLISSFGDRHADAPPSEESAPADTEPSQEDSDAERAAPAKSKTSPAKAKPKSKSKADSASNSETDGAPTSKKRRAAPKADSAAHGQPAPAAKNRRNASRRQPSSTSRSNAPTEVSIALSAGVSLPQSLPTGTAMSFSVDYRFQTGQPDPAANYVWVIQAGDGQRGNQAVKLASRGTLRAVLPQVRPDQGPFQAYIEDARGHRLSERAPLR